MTSISPLFGALFFHATLIGKALCGESFVRAAFRSSLVGQSFFGPSLLGPSFLGASLFGPPLIEAALFGRRHTRA